MGTFYKTGDLNFCSATGKATPEQLAYTKYSRVNDRCGIQGPTRARHECGTNVEVVALNAGPTALILDGSIDECGDFFATGEGSHAESLTVRFISGSSLAFVH